MKKATRIFTSTFGAIMALAGIEHGIGEVLQGSVVPDGIMIQSWPYSEFFRNLNGEPAMTIIPNLLITGILAILVSLILIIWSIFFVQRKNGGLVMILISIAMLLVGGGIFPPVFGMITGAVGTRINSPSIWLNKHLSTLIKKVFIRVWPWSIAACIITWLSVFPIAYFFGEKYLFLLLYIFVFALGTIFLSIISSFVYDAQNFNKSNVPPIELTATPGML